MPSSHHARLLPASVVLVLAAACSDSPAPPSQETRTLTDLVSRPRDGLAGAAEVTFQSVGFTSAVVRYRLDPSAPAPTDDDGETPPCPLADGANQVTVLGLLADTPYEFDLELYVGTELVRIETSGVRTPPLPAWLDGVQLEVSGDTTRPGLLLADVPTAQGRGLVAFDAIGRVRWYYTAPLLGNFSQRLQNGNFGAFIGTTTGWQATYGYFLEVTPAGDVVARHQAPPPFYTDEHDLLLRAEADGWSATLFSYDIRTVDATSVGGRRDARIAGHQILRYSADGSLDFLWNAWDNIGLGELVEPVGNLEEADMDHPNSIAFADDGNYIVSFRNLSQVMKIASNTGAVLWRLGGRRNEFSWQNDPLNGFSAQHSAVPLANNHLLVFDNGTRHFPPESRAVEYELDPIGRTAKLVWQFRHDPPIYTPYTGSVQRLDDGNTMVGFAYTGIATEVDAQSVPVWEGRLTVGGTPALTYRMKRIGSLYDVR